MMPEDKIEEKFEELIDYLKWHAKIVRKIFTPDAFNYPFWFPVFENDPRVPLSKISYTDIRKGKFVFPDGIHPIIEVVQDLNLVEYIRTGDKKKLKPKVNLRVIVRSVSISKDNLEPQNINIQDITIVDDGTDKSFIKNWEKVFGEEIFLLRSDIILFLVVKNGTLEIRSLSMSKDNLSNNHGKIDLTKWDYDRVKFGVDLLIKGNISPFGNTKIRQRYFLSQLFLYPIGTLSKRAVNEEELEKLKRIKNDEYWLAQDIKTFAEKLWTDHMFRARRIFLYINSINLKENKNLLEIWEEKKRLLNEIRTNPDKYLLTLSTKAYWKKYDDLLYGRGIRILPGRYLITQYRINSKVQVGWEDKICNCLVLKDKYDEIVIYNMPEALVNYYKGLVDTKDGTTGRIGLVFSWPLGDSYDNYLTFFSINSPFNPYIEKDGNLYIPDEIVEFLLDAIDPEPKIGKWMEIKAKEDQKVLYERLYDLLQELERGELRNDTVYMFDNTGEEDTDKRKRIESWKKEWEKLTEEIQTYESKSEQIEERKQVQTVEQKDEGKKDNEIIEKVKEYLNSEEYKQEIVLALQKLLEKDPEYKEFVEFVDKSYPSLISRRNTSKEVKSKVDEYWVYDKDEKLNWLLPDGVYLIIYKNYDFIWGTDWEWTDFITRKELKENGEEIFYALKISSQERVKMMPYVLNGLVYVVFYKGKYYFITTELADKLYTYLYCGTAYRTCFWMPKMVLKVIWPIFEKMAEKIKREVFGVIEDKKPIEELKPVEEPKIEKQIEKQEGVFETKKEEEKEQKFIEELEQEVEIHEEEEEKQLQTVEPKTDDEIIDDEIMDEIMEKATEKIEEYLNSEEYKQELISALQKLLEENPEYRKINEFMKEYYPENVPTSLSGIPKRIYRWRNEYWGYDTETKESQLHGVYLVIYEWFKLKGRHNEIYLAYIASRKGLDKDGNEKVYAKLIKGEYIPDVGNRLVYAVLYKGKVIDFITTELPNELYAYLYCGTSSRVCIWMPEMVLKVIWPIFQKMAEKINFQKMVEEIKREVLSSVKEEEKQEAQTDKEQMEITEKPKHKKKEEKISEVQQKEQKDTTEKPKRKKKEEKISEPQQEQEKKGKEEKVEATTESKKATEEIEQKTEETKEQDIIEELESADVEVETKVKSKVQIKLPKEMIEDLEEPKKKIIQKRKSTKANKSRKKKGKR